VERLWVTNALSFDVEDYFQVSNFEKVVTRDEWPKFQYRVDRNTDLILSILNQADIKATFFVLGWIANTHPTLVKRIAAQKHEVASHGWSHRAIYEQSRGDFEAETCRGIALLQDLTGEKVLGYRAASFSVIKETLWVLDFLQQAGLVYDSSIFPVFHPRYGIPNARHEPHEIRPGFWEFPPAVLRIGRFNLPVAGGGYFRIFPYWLTSLAIRRINRSRTPVMVYLHPWEFDPEQPRLEASLQARFRHYHNLAKTADRVRRLCADFKFGKARQVLNI
jgi:polysaccharide deacetylase family protein (PEP-CTERM system associated)